MQRVKTFRLLKYKAGTYHFIYQVSQTVLGDNLSLFAISSLNLHYIFQRVLCTQKRNFSWVQQKWKKSQYTPI